MRGVRVVVGAVLVQMALGSWACAEGPPAMPMLANLARTGLRFCVIDGQVSMVSPSGRFYNRRSSSTSFGGRREELVTQRDQEGLRLSYTLTTTKRRLSLVIASHSGFTLSQEPRKAKDVVPLRFAQNTPEQTVLDIGDGEAKVSYQAESLWHLWILHPEVCRTHLLPLLSQVQPDWQLEQIVADVQDSLIGAAKEGRLPKRRVWRQLVDQLASESFGEREAADRKLRSLGRPVLGYLRHLDFSQLDAEQQYRLRRILRALSHQTTDDLPEQIAEGMLGDVAIWLALVTRDDLAVRQVSARHLSVLFDDSVVFDAAADAATRQRQVEAIRTAAVRRHLLSQ